MFYCIAARIIGWVLVILWGAIPALSIPFCAYKALRFHVFPPDMLLMLSGSLAVLFGQLPLGIIVLGVAQLIRYVSESEYQPGWLLRHGTGILYLFAVLMLVNSVIRYCFLMPIESSGIGMFLLPDVAKMLILIGLAEILKRVLPVIEESKTLV